MTFPLSSLSHQLMADSDESPAARLVLQAWTWNGVKNIS